MEPVERKLVRDEPRDRERPSGEELERLAHVARREVERSLERESLVVDAHRVHYEALTLKGAFHFTPRDVREAFQLLAGGALPVSRLVSDELPLHRLHEAIERLEKGECLKLAIKP